MNEPQESPAIKESGLPMPDIAKQVAELRPEQALREAEEPELPIGLTKQANAGRPTKMTPEIRAKIEDAAALDATNEEIAFYAGIHRRTLYEWLKADEALSHRVQELREKPVLRARQTVVKSLDDPNFSFRYLERKRAKEFMPSAKIEHSGSVAFTPGQVTPEQEALRVEYEEKLRQTLMEQPSETTSAPEAVQAVQGEPKPSPDTV